MYPDPPDALPLTQSPSVEQYRKRAKDLVKACAQGPEAIEQWALAWLDALAGSHADADAGAGGRFEAIRHRAVPVAEFARRRLCGAAGRPACRLSDAQFVMARVHGFPSWPVFIAHLQSLAHAGSAASAFDAAADAIVVGDAETLSRLLREHPRLVQERSTREHHATLLHYVSANGVEGYRQKTPANAVAIARMLLDGGAEIDATADVYGGGCTTLGLVATSVHPQQAGVQRDLIDLLLAHGARLDLRASGNGHSLVRGCLANGQPDAAEYLASRGAPLDLPGAAGVGRLDVVAAALDGEEATDAEKLEAFSHACAYGQRESAALLVDRGVDVNAELTLHGHGHTGLHVAAYWGHPEVVDVLLRRGAGIDTVDRKWGTPPLVWALTGYKNRPAADPARYEAVIAHLIRGGAEVTPELRDWAAQQADPVILRALEGGSDGG